jgi:transcriptional regulator with AAA-type ATPase domain/tetratricopeptide (TPR) repeat protein
MDELADLLGESPTIDVVRDKVRRLLDRQRAGQRLPAILLQGDTGTGKGLVARLLHRHGPRRHAPFVDVNCAAIPETLLEAELFGFERGAFTDARRAKPGLFQAAHGGVLFLDEVALLPDPLQAKLLTAVEERAVRRLGSTRLEPADAWVISATNTDLPAAVRARRFREDLYHRLAVLTLALPTLRDRGQDILLLAERFLARACTEYRLPPKRLDPGAQARLLAYAWPGNIRELANVIERAALFADTSVLTADSLGPLEAEAAGVALDPLPGTTTSRDEAMRQHLLTALERTGWNISHTATRLGITRTTVYARLEKFGLRPAPSHQAAPGPPGSVEPATGLLGRETRLQWEQRSLTLLRADLGKTDALDAWSRASRALDTVIAKVHSFGGYVEELTPMGLVAAFGLEPAEDAPRRAAHTAMAIQKEAARARDRGEEVPGITIGLHVATLLIGRVGMRLEIDAVAKRAQWPILDQLLQARTPGHTFATAAAGPFLERRFELARLDEGANRREPAYRLTGQERRGLGLWGAMTQFVGRREELDLLRTRAARSRDGHGQVVAVIGEAGVGKSRLIYESARAHRLEGWRVLEGPAVSYGQAMSYLPVIALLKEYFAIQDRDDPREVNEKVTEKLRTLDTTLQPTLPAFLALLDVPVDNAAWRALDPPQRRQRTLDAVRRLLLREAGEQSLLLIFEDLHWIDRETQALLDGLVETLGSARLLLLVSYRPEYQHAWGSKTYYRQLRIDPLPAESAEDLLASLLGDDPGLQPLKRLLIDRTEGNPLFLEESIRTLVETGAVAGERGAHRLTRPIQAIEVPATVQVILAARIDRLSADDKQLLQTASVVGKDVPSVLLHAVAEAAEDAVHRGLARLQAAELLYETRLFPEPEYTFKHALTHDVTYGTLLQERRKTLHARIVGAFERFYPDRLTEHVERLAYHAARGELWDKAVAYLRQAGLRATARAANREAIAHLEEALGALRRLPETRETTELTIDIHFDLRNALNPLADQSRMGEHLHEAEGLARTLGDQRRLGRVAMWMVSQCMVTGDYDEAFRFAQEALNIGRTLGDRSIEVEATVNLGMMHAARGEFSDAATVLERNVVALEGDLRYERFGGSFIQSAISGAYLADALAQLGRFDEAIGRAETAVRIAEAADHPFSLYAGLLGLGFAHLRRGDLPHATRVLERSLDLCRTWQFVARTSVVAAALGAAYALAGRADEALPLVAGAVEEFRRGTGSIWPALILLCAGTTCLQAGRIDGAASHAREALALARRWGARGSEAHALCLAGDVASIAGAEDADGSYREALALAGEFGMRPLVAHCHRGLGKLYRRTGKRQEAQEHLTIATTMYREMDMTYWLEQAEAEMGA